MIELADAHSHQQAMMIEFVDTFLALIAVPHSDPLIEAAQLTVPLFLELSSHLSLAVSSEARGVVLGHEILEKGSKEH